VLQDVAAEDRFVDLFTAPYVYYSDEVRYRPQDAPADLRSWVEHGNHAAFTISDIEDVGHDDFDVVTFTAQPKPGNIFDELGYDPALFAAQHTPGDEFEYQTYPHRDGAVAYYAVIDLGDDQLIAATRGRANADYLRDVVQQITAPN
jgi:hypothetical protein